MKYLGVRIFKRKIILFLLNKNKGRILHGKFLKEESCMANKGRIRKNLAWQILF